MCALSIYVCKGNTHCVSHALYVYRPIPNEWMVNEMFAQHVIFNVRQKVRSKLLNYLHPHKHAHRYTLFMCVFVLSVLARNAIDFSYPLTLH